MKFEPGDSYKVDENTEITDLFEAPEDANYDSVICEVDGRHPVEEGRGFYNEKNQKSYFVLNGSGKIHVGEEIHRVEKGDWIYVPEETFHALEGDFRALIVTSPPFNPENEKIVEK